MSSNVSNPLAGLINGLLTGHNLAMQMKRQAMEEQAFKTNQALHEQQMSMQDIMNRQMLDQNARPISDAGTVEDQLLAAPEVPGQPQMPGGNPQIPVQRPADKSRMVKYGGRQYELLTPEEQAQKAITRQVNSETALDVAKTEAQQKARQNVLKLRGVPVPADISQALRMQPGQLALPEEIPGLAQKAMEVIKGGYQKLAPGETLVAPNIPGQDGQPGGFRTVATGGAPLPTDDFGKYFLPAYTAKVLQKPLAEVTADDMKKLSPEQVQDAFGKFSSSKETEDTKAMRTLAQSTAKLHQSLLQMQIGQQPTRDDAKNAAQMVLNRQMSPSQMTTMFGGFGAQGQAFKRMVVGEIAKMDPKFNFEEAESEFGLVKSPQFQNTVRYMDSVQESIPLVIDRAKKLANGNIRGINALVNAGKNQFNGVDLKKFETDRTLVADEIAKILQGGGTGSGTSDMKLKQAGEILKSTDSPRAIAAALEDVNMLIGYRRKSLTRGTYMEVPKATGAIPGAAPAAGADPLGLFK